FRPAPVAIHDDGDMGGNVFRFGKRGTLNFFGRNCNHMVTTFLFGYYPNMLIMLFMVHIKPKKFLRCESPVTRFSENSRVTGGVMAGHRQLVTGDYNSIMSFSLSLPVSSIWAIYWSVNFWTSLSPRSRSSSEISFSFSKSFRSSFAPRRTFRMATFAS